MSAAKGTTFILFGQNGQVGKQLHISEKEEKRKKIKGIPAFFLRCLLYKSRKSIVKISQLSI